MKVDYIIFYEHVARELESAILLKSKLDSKNLKGVILPIHFNRYINMIKYRPKIIILPFLYKYEDSYFAVIMKKFNRSLLVANLHSEQIGSQESQARMLPLDEGSRNVYHFVWGDFFKELLIKEGIDKNLIYAYGSIRNDTLFEHNNKKTDNKKIIIPTSFSMTFVDESYIENAIKTRNIDRDKFLKGLKFREKSRDEFFKIIHKLSKIKIDYKFILRPHPYVDLDQYKEVYCNVNKIKEIPKNLKIERKGSIAEAISYCETVIVWHSTSILEAKLMGKKIFQLAPFPFNEQDQMEYMKYVEKGSNLEDCIKFIDDKKKDNLELDKYIRYIYGKVDGKACERIATKINEILITTEYEMVGIKENLNLIIQLILKSIFIDIPKNVLRYLNLLDKIKPSFKGIMEDYIEIKK